VAEAFVARLARVVDVGGDDADLLQDVLHIFSLLFRRIRGAHDELCQLGDDLNELLLYILTKLGQKRTARLKILRAFFPASASTTR